MRISTKLAILAGFAVILSFGTMVETVKADESNQTKINFNIVENILTIGQTNVCMAEELAPTAEVMAEKKVEEVKKEENVIETKKVPNNSNLPEGKFIINASAYTAAADECGKSDGITASGKKVKENETIACPKNFAFGTKVNIEGYGTYICQDRGGAIKGNKIDIYMETKAQAFAFGRRNLVAQIVTE
ncbi:MAG: 3D domain-containing protein [Parcubacteria group bacterium]|jgi:3D (Asp-Asp-Asp) domain-containing protein